MSSPITPNQLRVAASKALELDEFLEECRRQRVLSLMGFDLPWLAAQFDDAADKLGG